MHPKKGRSVLCQRVPVRYAFIKDHREEFRVRTMCRVMRVHPSGFYAWLKEPESARAKANKQLLGLIRASYAASDGIYGSRRIHRDLMEMGEVCGENRVARLMQANGI